MLKGYVFKRQPVFSIDYQETTIQTEDFHKIMRLANSSLNCTCSASTDLPQQNIAEKAPSGSIHYNQNYYYQRQYVFPHVQYYPGPEPKSIQTQLSALLSLEQSFGSQKLRS